jgi:hypothetical protein
MEIKKCTTCKSDKPLSEYRKDKSRTSGYSPSCNDCNKEAQRRWYQNNKAKAKTKAKVRYAANKDAINKKRKEKHSANPDVIRKQKRDHYRNNKDKHREYAWRAAGMKDMTVARYDKMLDEQDGCCAICKTHHSELSRKLSVDHDHVTGVVRSLLCDNCNRAIGYLKESVTIMQSAINYLNKH